MVCNSAPVQTISTATTTPGAAATALPLTPELAQQARANYLLSKEITYPIVTRGSTHLKQVALTFDDGPHPGRTEELLQVLAQLHVHATFFVVGKMAEKAPYLIQEEILGGHEVANHTFNHIHVTSLDDAQIAHEIDNTNDVVRKFTGEPAVLFRPPGGRLSWGAYRALHACGMVTVLWTDDPRDYTNPGNPDPVNQKMLLKRLMDHIRPGGIILLHDGILDTVAILPEFIRELRARGYEVGTVTQLLLAEQHREWPEQLARNHPAAAPVPGKAQPNWVPVPGSIVVPATTSTPRLRGAHAA
jgi:peptidoglycan/xylan/chitin deacetylase (PgdA/CDA1 family)